MNLVADEGVDKIIVDLLRESGFTVRYFAEADAGAPDQEVLAAATAVQNLLLTCDKDFGELVFRQQLSTAGVVLIRLAGLTGVTKSNVVLRTLQKHANEMAQSFTVISPGMVRIRHRS